MLLVIQLIPSCAFLLNKYSTTRSCCSTTTLFGLKRQRRGLADLTEGGIISSPKKLKPSKVTQSDKATGGGVSPALAQWAAAGGESVPTNVEQGDNPISSSPQFVAFDDEKKGRRTKQSERMEQDKRNYASVQLILDELDEILGQKGSGVENILEQIQMLMNLPSANFRVMTAGKEQYFYRLAWVGSDDAICQIGSGLHKVPLARLQEIFLTFQGKNRIELFEVISILGPFPNVRNTLQGGSEVTAGEVTEWTISLDSMVDGTGKEILAGKEENIRRVNLQIYFADPNAIVAVVPPKKGEIRKNPLEDNGSNVLIFVREDNIEGKLEALRVL